jgi:hypothetical protein
MLIPVKQQKGLLDGLLDCFTTFFDILANTLNGIAPGKKHGGSNEAQQLFHCRLQKTEIISHAQRPAGR